MIEGLAVIRTKGRLEVICPAHPDAVLDKRHRSDTEGPSRIFWQLSFAKIHACF